MGEPGETRDFAYRLLQRRRQLGLDQVELGRAIGKTKQHIDNWEKRRASFPALEVFFKLADALDMDPRLLAFGHQDRLTAPLFGFPTSDTGRHRLLVRRK